MRYFKDITAITFLAICFIIPITANADLAESNYIFKVTGDINKAKLEEPSGIVYHTTRDSLFVVGDRGDIVEIKTDGTLINKKKLMSADFEGITFDPATGYLYIAIEGKESIVEVEPTDLKVLREFQINRIFEEKNALPADKNGIEGITFAASDKHPEGGTFFIAYQSDNLVGEEGNSAILEVVAPLKTSKRKTDKAAISQLIPFPIIDLSGLHYDIWTDRIFITSDKANALIVTSRDGQIIKRHTIPGKNQEGVTFDKDDFLYIADDSGKILRIELEDKKRSASNSFAIEIPIASSEDSITATEATEFAIEASDTIAVLRQIVKVAKETSVAAFDMRSPELRVGMDSEKSNSRKIDAGILSSDSDDASGYSIGMRFFPNNPWIKNSRLSTGNANHFASIADLRAEQWRISIEVRRLFATIHFLNQETIVLNRLVKVFEDMQIVMRQRTKEGHSTVQDLMQASRAYLGMLSARNEITQDLLKTRQILSSMINISEENLKITQPKVAIPNLSTIDIDKLIGEVVKNRADISALSWRSLASKSLHNEARAEKYPWLQHVQLSYSNADDENGDNTRFSDSDEWSVTAAINIPIFNAFNNTPNLRKTESELASIREKRAIDLVGIETRDAIASMKRIALNKVKYKTETDPVIKEMKDVLENIESVSGMDPDEAAKMKKVIFETERLKLRNNYEYHLAAIRLEEVLGVRFQPKAKGE